jgi:hypothetical protein
MYFQFATVITLLALFSTAHADLMELSASYSTRTSKIDDNNYTTSQSWTGSFAWYFWEMSALELSYTNGLGEQVLTATDSSPTHFYQVVEMYGLDLVLTLADRSAFIQPFVRGGVAHLRKRIYQETAAFGTQLYGDPVDAIVPSYGVGLNLKITDAFSLKGSYDRWESGTTGNSGIWDDAFKAGVSWYF